MTDHAKSSPEKPVLIIGAGISGLVLAQHLQRENIPFRIFERDGDFTTRGVGWGLTLHWCLPSLKELLPEDLVQRLPECYVDRPSVQRGVASTFPFFDLSTGTLRSSTPEAPESDRIRVTREGLRRLLATEIDINWNKSLVDLVDGPDSDSVSATFEDGSSVDGRLLVACDGAQSRVRRKLFPEQWETYKIPVRILGVKVHVSPSVMKPIQNLDPFFLQGTASENNSFVYISVLDAPGNNADSPDSYTCQICVSWPYRSGFMGNAEPVGPPSTNEERHSFIQNIANTWAEPFRSFMRSVLGDQDIKDLTPQDFVPPKGLRTPGRAVLMGDSVHAMAMYRGEGANHSIVDVADFVKHASAQLKGHDSSAGALRPALDAYEDAVVTRASRGVLASRQACLDAHDWPRITATSPLLTKRDPNIKI